MLSLLHGYDARLQPPRHTGLCEVNGWATEQDRRSDLHPRPLRRRVL